MNDRTEVNRLLLSHLALLEQHAGHQHIHEVSSTPIITASVLSGADKILSPPSGSVFKQYGLLAGDLSLFNGGTTATAKSAPISETGDPRLFFNISAPSSTFICGSQGSGKSHTLSCLLENCLMASEASQLPAPLTGLVFHYDSFISDRGGTPCEAAFLSSTEEIQVRVLCAPTSLKTMQLTYENLPNVRVEPLRISEGDLNTKRMLDLMAVNSGNGPVPLYVHTVNRILREMRLDEQELGVSFNYQKFKQSVLVSGLSPAQLGPLTQRFDSLESFMPDNETGKRKRGAKMHKNIPGIPKDSIVKTASQWCIEPGSLTIIDLSCPCITAETACSLFNISLALFLEQDMETGRVIALDEAHKFMNSSTESNALTDTLLSTIRLQRHLGARIIISTQEPTISPALLDLSSVTIVHRFTSPEWLRALKSHLAAAAWDLIELAEEDGGGEQRSAGKNRGAKALFAEIISLGVGEALLFAPSTIVGLDKETGDGKEVVKRLGGEYLKIKVRARLTADGGKSVMAT